MIYVSRVLGSTKFGIVSVAQAPIGVAYLLINIGTDQALTKYISQYRYERKTENLKPLIEAGLIIGVAVGLLYSFATFFAAGFLANQVFHEPELEALIKIFSFAVVGQSLITTAWSIIIGYERMALKSYHSIFYSILKSLLSPILVYLGYGPIGAALGEAGPMLFAGILGVIFIYVIWKSEKDSSSSLSRIEAMKMLLVYGYPLFFSNFIAGMRPNINMYIMSQYVSTALIGNYSVSTRFSALLGFVVTPISLTMLPLFSKFENKREDLEFIYRSSVKYTSLIVYPMTSAIMAMSPQIIEILYGGDYPQASLYMRLYLALFFLVGLGSLSNIRLLNSQRLTRDTLYLNILQNLVTLPMNLVLIPRYGVVGLLVSELIGPRVGTAYALWVIKKKFGISLDYKATVKIFLSAIAGFLVAAYLFSFTSWNPWLELLAGGLLVLFIYLTGIVFSGALLKRDIQDIKTITGSLGPLTTVMEAVLDVLVRYAA
ncbi:flippase [Candidatus Bathyarchaeota archaeon]|nr:flippase [Candidatus Bathyarchaeota archaeon]